MRAPSIQAYPGRELAVDQPLSVVTWNLGKRRGQDAVVQVRSLCALQGSVLLAIQECREDLDVPREFGAHFARGFRVPFTAASGVMSLCAVAPSQAWVLRAPHRELAVTTPKVALLTRYPMSDGRALLLVNVHALNFERAGRRFVAQMSGLASALDEHEGPLLFCGDFNTWQPQRLGHLRGLASARGLLEVSAPAGIGRTGGATRLGNLLLGLDPTLELDRIFYRGLEIEHERWLPELDASDHVPLMAHFRF